MLVALNAVFQVLLYAVLGYFYLQVLPGWLGLRHQLACVHRRDRRHGGGLPRYPAGGRYLTRTIGERAKGREWYETKFLPRIAPVALYGLLFTVVILFALQGKKITSAPLDVARIALSAVSGGDRMDQLRLQRQRHKWGHGGRGPSGCRLVA